MLIHIYIYCNLLYNISIILFINDTYLHFKKCYNALLSVISFDNMYLKERKGVIFPCMFMNLTLTSRLIML